MNKIRPFLWFDREAIEAARFYVSVFEPSARLLDISDRSATFELAGTEYVAFNGGPHYALTPAVSMFVDCATQTEVDRLWETLGADGEYLRCGWLKDRFGLCWQIIPSVLGDFLNDPDHAKAERVMNAMLGMVKLDIAALTRAYEG